MTKFFLFIETWFPGIANFVKRWPGISWMNFIAFGLWMFSVTFLHWLDPTAGTYDAGVLQAIVYVIVAVTIFMDLAFLVAKFNFPGFWQYYTTDFKNDFLNLTPWQKQLLSFSLVLGLCFFFALLASAILAAR